MPSVQAMGYSPFEKSLLNSFTKKGEIMSYEHLKSSAHRLSVLLLFFCENTAFLISLSVIIQNQILSQSRYRVPALVAETAHLFLRIQS